MPPTVLFDAGKPVESCFAIIESPDVPAVQDGEKREHLGAAMRGGTVKHGQPLLV